MSDRDEIIATAHKLAETIKQSGVYQKYRASLSVLKEKPQLFLRVQAFKEAANREPVRPVSLEKEKNISNQYTALLNDPETAAFIANENEFLKTYSDVLDVIDDGLEMELFS